MTNAKKSNDEEAFFAAVGRLTLVWAHIELALDAAISIIHQTLSGNTVERDAPVHLGRKIKYLKLCLRKLQPLAPYREHTLPMLAELAEQVEFRKTVVHGCVVSHPIASAEVEVIRFLHKSDSIHTVMHLKLSTEAVQKAYDEALRLSSKATYFAVVLVRDFLK